ncbi:MAG TPA: membrane protein insertion efficiency factor YidD [Acidobacteriaceae bacterium]|nr:membrane protein insertion efficiency factor YidD [Acidobacteriaceae bacterium]
MKQDGKGLRTLRDGIFAGLLLVYKRALSPAMHALGGASGACRYQPTCSEYAAIAVSEYGLLRGGAMALGRLLRCHPLCRGGFDPVPARRGAKPAVPAGQAH